MAVVKLSKTKTWRNNMISQRSNGTAAGAVLVALTLALLLAAPAGAKGLTGSIPVKPDQEPTAYTLAEISLTDALQAALKELPGRAVEADLNVEDGYVVYGVEVVGANGTITDVKIDAGNGRVLAHDTSEVEQNDNEGDQADGEDSTSVQGSTPAPSEQSAKLAMSKLAKVSLADAIGSARAESPGTVLEAKLEDENGFVVYGVEIAGANDVRADVKVDAGTGKVLRHEAQTGQDEHKGQGQENENGQEQGNEQENDGE